MRKMILRLALVLPMLALSCCSSDDPESPSLSGGDGPIEEPILAFYDSPQEIKSQEKRKLLEEENSSAFSGLLYEGATSAIGIVYLFKDGAMYSASTEFAPKNKDRVMDFIRNKYVEIKDEDSGEEHGVLFESQDQLIVVNITSTIASTFVTYSRQYSDEEVNGVYHAPLLKWGATVQEIKTYESNRRKLVEEGENMLVFAKNGIWGEVTYLSVDMLGLNQVSVIDIPGIAYAKVMKQIEAEYIPCKAIAGFEKMFLSKDGKVKLGVIRNVHTSFDLMYFLQPGME